jgi:hypothetical protein
MKMTKKERDLFYSQINEIFPLLSAADQSKMNFVQKFLKDRFQVVEINSNILICGSQGSGSLKFFSTSHAIFDRKAQATQINRQQVK